MSQDDQKQLNRKKEIPVQGNKTGGFIKILKGIVKSLLNSVVDMPQHTLQQQEQLKKMQTQEGLDASGKGNENSPENLEPKKQDEVKKAGKGLKEKMIRGFGDSDKSIEVKAPGETPAKDVDQDSQKSIER